MKTKTKLTLLTLSLVNILHFSMFAKTNYAFADSSNYENNVFQMCEYQDQTNNLFLGDSIFNLDDKTIGLHNSICLNQPSTNHLSIALKYNVNIFNLNINKFTINLAFTNKDDPSNTLKLNEVFSDWRDFDYYSNSTLDILIQGKYLILTIDTSSLGDHFIFHGVDKDDYFFINIDSPTDLYVEEFLLIDYKNSNSLMTNYQNLYTKPERGNYQNTSIKHHNQTLSLVCDVNNPISIDELLNSVKAYDYSDNSEVEVTYNDISYLDAIDRKELGKYYLNLLATDSKNNTSVLKVEISLEDLYAPMINLLQEGDRIEIPISSCLTLGEKIDLNNYVIITDNYEQNLKLTNETQYFIYEDLQYKNVILSVVDSSGNRIDKAVNVRVYDDIYPTITSKEENIIVRPYQYKSADEIIDEYLTIQDNINVESINITNDTFSNNYKYVGSYSFEVSASDEEGNITTKTINVKVEDYQGPVFFIYEANLTLTSTNEYISATQMYNMLVKENKIKNKQYKVVEYANDVYNKNYKKEGTYQVYLACYDEDYQKEYIKVNLNITKGISKTNFFTKIGKFFENLFKTIEKFFSNIINKVVNWFKK